MARRLTIATACVLLSLSSCAHQLASAYNRLGVTVDDGALLIRYIACADERVEYVRLYQLDGDQNWPDDGDILLWEGAGANLVSLADGIHPLLGTGEKVELATGATYLVDIRTSRNKADSSTFTTKDLRLGEARVNRKNKSEAAFIDGAQQSCKSKSV